MASIPQQYRAALQTWVENNIHKAVHTTEPFNIVRDEDDNVVSSETEDYLDIHELSLRLGRKIWKAAPELRGTYDLQDLEELLDDKKALLLSLAGVTKIGSGPRNIFEIDAEDPDV